MADDPTPPEEENPPSRRSRSRSHGEGDQLTDPIVDPVDDYPERPFEDASEGVEESSDNYVEEPNPSYRPPVYD